MYTLVYEKNPINKDIRKLDLGLSKHAALEKGQGPILEFAFFIRKKHFLTKGSIKGGCHGCMYYGCLYVDQLWVDQTLRGKGYGTQLMQAAEDLGKQKGCLFATVNTMDWEALDFYKKLGYFVEFERHGYLKNSVFYFLRKQLV